MTTAADSLETARAIVRREGRGVADVADQLDATFVTAVEMIGRVTGKVFVTGSGTSGAVARRMAHLLSVCGTPSLFLPGMDALHGTMGAVVRGDLLITISRGGESDELNDLSRRVQQRDVPVIALTAVPGSSLGRLADLTVVVDPGPEVDPGGVIAMGSTLATAVWGDALAAVLMQQRGYGWEQVLSTHPAGAVGRLETLPPALPVLGSPAATGAAPAPEAVQP